jgi:hypothetical protein
MGAGYGGRADPITGNSGWHPGEAQREAAQQQAAPMLEGASAVVLEPPSPYNHFPQKVVVLFQAANFEKLRGAFAKSLCDSPDLLTAAESAALNKVIDKAENKATNTRFSAAQVCVV